jgi:Right handed beta helix region
MTRSIFIAAAFALAAVLPAIPAQATSLTRTFVSSAGSDSNPCTITQPCATFAQAYSLTLASGIIAALDPGKYGPLTITGPVTIDGNGWASITAPAVLSGVTINATDADAVTLTGLKIDGAGVAAHGILFNSGGALTVQNVVSRNMGCNGLYINTSDANPATVQTFEVSDSSFIHNGCDGIAINSQGSDSLTVTINRTAMSENHVNGLSANAGTAGAVAVAATNSAASNNGGDGFLVEANGATNNVTITNSLISSNLVGINVTIGAAAWLSQCTMTGNSNFGYTINTGSVINSWGDNNIANNGSNTGSLTPVNKQ